MAKIFTIALILFSCAKFSLSAEVYGYGVYKATLIDKTDQAISNSNILVEYDGTSHLIKTDENGTIEIVINYSNSCRSNMNWFSSIFKKNRIRYNPQKIKIQFQNEIILVEKNWNKYFRSLPSDPEVLSFP